MLEPRSRRLLADALRPPPGYALDCAIGTTFSLDLLAGLTVPLSLSQWQYDDASGPPLADPIVLLDAVRSHLDRIHIFCQAGQITVPRRYRPLFTYMEDAVFEVEAPHPEGVFHAKVWVLRFTAAAETEPVHYRLLVLSRNLTFDCSWDTMLTLEGALSQRRNAFSRNHPLGDFIAALPDLAKRRPLPERVLADVQRVQEELRRVDFAVPEGLEKEALAFWPLGLSRRTQPWPFPERIHRLLVVSPFLSPSVLARLTERGSGHVLVSRLEELAPLTAGALASFEQIYTLHQNAGAEPEEPEAADDAVPAQAESALDGLHAKLFVVDAGWNARLWTGSANATEAAFQRNVEFLVELGGKKSRCGIDALLRADQGEVGLGSLLAPYTVEEGALDNAEQQALKERAEAACRAVARAGLAAGIDPAAAAGEYQMTLVAEGDLPALPPAVAVACWPITLREAAAVPLATDQAPLACFGPLSLEALTGFFAFTVTAAAGDLSATRRFVLNLPLLNPPEGRRQAVLRAMLQNRQQVLRYLLLLLGALAPDPAAAFAGDASPGGTGPAAGAGTSAAGLPLLEAMVRTLHRCPDQLDQIKRVVDDLRQTPEGRQMLPEGFDEVWEPIWRVREELRG